MGEKALGIILTIAFGYVTYRLYKSRGMKAPLRIGLMIFTVILTISSLVGPYTSSTDSNSSKEEHTSSKAEKNSKSEADSSSKAKTKSESIASSESKKAAAASESIASAKASSKAKLKSESVASASSSVAKAQADSESRSSQNNVPAEDKSALSKAEDYANTMDMSKQGVYEQLTSDAGEQFSASAAQYAIDHLTDVDWNENALKKAKDYQDNMSMSPAEIHDQLTSSAGEQFTQAEADYAIQHLND